MLDFLLKAFHEFFIYFVAPTASVVVAPFLIIWIRRGLLKKIFNTQVIIHYVGIIKAMVPFLFPKTNE